MEGAFVRTSLLSPKLSRTNPFHKTCIDYTQLKIEIRNIAIDRKIDGVAMTSLALATLALFAVLNYFDFQVLSTLLQFQRDDD